MSMLLRYVIEAAQWAAYAMGNEEQEKFYSEDSNGDIFIEDKHEKVMYKWLDKNFKVKADETRRAKKMISEAGAHSNIVFVFQNVDMNSYRDGEIKATFFDQKNDHKIKCDLWFIANTALGILDLFYLVNKQYKAFSLVDDFGVKFKELIDQNIRLQKEVKSTENYKRALGL